MTTTIQSDDLVIIGGGIMGLMTAYYASAFVDNITILEKKTIGCENKEAASFSFTRSIRVDFLEPFYARLAYEAVGMWRELEKLTDKRLFVNCGCMNIAKDSITPNLEQTYAERSYQNIKSLNFKPRMLSRTELRQYYPQFEADIGTLDNQGGFLFLPAITELMLRLLKSRGVKILENTNVVDIQESSSGVLVESSRGRLVAESLVVVAGKGTNEVLGRVRGNRLQLPITYNRPQRKYYYPSSDIAEHFLPENFPVFAYTDVGIYGHPIFDRAKGAVKVAYFVPVGIKKDDQKIRCVEDFVNECLPVLKDVPSEEITDADNCWYDIVADDDFILGELPGFKRILVGTGWRGTGYKFAPWVGKTISQLALQRGTVYDINQFSLRRFNNETVK